MGPTTKLYISKTSTYWEVSYACEVVFASSYAGKNTGDHRVSKYLLTPFLHNAYDLHNDKLVVPARVPSLDCHRILGIEISPYHPVISHSSNCLYYYVITLEWCFRGPTCIITKSTIARLCGFGICLFIR